MKPSPSQEDICLAFGSHFVLPHPDSKVGIALNTLGLAPLNALRHKSEGGTCGWYIWGGEVFSQESDFFQPLHVHHLDQHCPEIIPYLALAPGWRVLIALGQIDVWYEPALLES